MNASRSHPGSEIRRTASDSAIRKKISAMISADAPTSRPSAPQRDRVNSLTCCSTCVRMSAGAEVGRSTTPCSAFSSTITASRSRSNRSNTAAKLWRTKASSEYSSDSPKLSDRRLTTRSAASSTTTTNRSSFVPNSSYTVGRGVPDRRATASIVAPWNPCWANTAPRRVEAPDGAAPRPATPADGRDPAGQAGAVSGRIAPLTRSFGRPPQFPVSDVGNPTAWSPWQRQRGEHRPLHVPQASAAIRSQAMHRTLFDDEHELFRDSVPAVHRRRRSRPTTTSGSRPGSSTGRCSPRPAPHGFLGMAAPEEHGGGGVDDFRYNLVIAEEIQRAGVNAAGLGWTLHNDICLPYFLSLCTDGAAGPVAARHLLGRADHRHRHDRARHRLRPRVDDHDRRSATATTTSSTGRRRSSPTASTPTSSSPR